MNTAATTFAVAAAISLGLSLAHQTEASAAEVVKLERVVVVAKRADVVAQLPRVIVEGRRDLTQVAAVQAAQATAWIL